MNRFTGVLGPVLVALAGAGSTSSAFAAAPGEQTAVTPAGLAGDETPSGAGDRPSGAPRAEASDRPAAADAPAKPTEPAAPAGTTPAADATGAGPENDDARKAYFLHAEALEAELDHEYPRALRLLREAHKLDPASPEVRFDLARIAALQGGTPDDLRPYFESPQTDADGKVLRGAVEARLTPEKPVASGRKLVGDLLTGSLRLGASADTNVALAPADGIQAAVSTGNQGDGKPVAGNRLVTTGLVDFAPLRGPLSVDVAGAFSLGRFTSDKDLGGGAKLSTFDANTLTLAARLSLDLGLLSVMVQVAGNDVLVGFGDTFLRSLDATGVVALGSFGGGHFGVFADAGLRSFGDDNGGDYDRSGPYVDGGLTFGIQTGKVFGLRGRLGVGTERAAGWHMRTYLALASLTAQVNVGPVHASGGVMNEARLYDDVGPSKLGDLAGTRFDNRLNPYARVVVDILDNLGVYAGYSFVKNYSTDDTFIPPKDTTAAAHFDRRYTRSFIEAGVEGRL